MQIRDHLLNPFPNDITLHFFLLGDKYLNYPYSAFRNLMNEILRIEKAIEILEVAMIL